MNEGIDFVEALEDGRIVRVTKEYAIREGLMILKNYERPKPAVKEERQPLYTRYRSESRGYVDLDKYRKPLKSNDTILASLIDNFSWVITSTRKSRNLTRKQLADVLGVSEDEVKTIEMGRLPRNDYVLVNKLESYFGVLLRKDPNVGKLNLEVRERKESRFLKEQTERVKTQEREEQKMSTVLSDDIEIIDNVD